MKDVVFDPMFVLPLYVTQVIVHFELVAFVKYGANVAIAGVQVVEAPTPVAMVPDFPAHDQESVWVNPDAFRFVLIVIVLPSSLVPDTVGSDARGIVVNVFVVLARIVPAEVLVLIDTLAETDADPLELWLTVNVVV